MLKRLVSFIFSACIIGSLCFSAISVKAEQISAGIITIDTVSGITGDTVIVPIKISENPGMMAMTISITYNSAALQYEDYYYGDVLRDYYVVDHPTKNLLRFVNCEKRDRSGNGTLLSLQFKIKDTAEADFHKIDIEYSAGDFCNWSLDKIMPEIVSGGVEVAYNGSNCKHKKYGEWTVAAVASCKDSGAEQRICKTCGHIDLRETTALGHEYSDSWTIDEPATPEKDGMMSRYCIRCDHYVDRMSFTYKHTENGNINNNVNADVPINDYTEGIFKEQYPDRELTDSKPKNEDTDTSSDTVSSNQSDKDTSSSGSADTPEPESPEDDEKASDTVTALDKLIEAFPKLEKIIEAFKISLIILLIIILR